MLNSWSTIIRGFACSLARVSKSACGRMKLSGMNIMNNMKRQVSMVAMSYLSDVQALINLGELEIARREVNFVKTLILDYPDMAAEVTDEELDGIYGRLVGVISSSVETIREEERHRIRRLSIAAYRETCLRKGDQCCSVCDCCPFSQAFVEKLAELTAVEGCQ